MAKVKLLIVGGAGYVGSIVVPTLEKEFECTHFDIKPVQGYEDHTILADVDDEEKVRQAVDGMDAIFYLAMGRGKDVQGRPSYNDINSSFDVNVRGLYRFLQISLKGKVNRVIDDMSGPNGLIVSKDGKTLYVADSIEKIGEPILFWTMVHWARVESFLSPPTLKSGTNPVYPTV